MTAPRSITVGTQAVFIRTRIGLKVCAVERVLDLDWLAEKCGVVAEDELGWSALLLRAEAAGAPLPPVYEVAVTLVVKELSAADAAAFWLEARQEPDTGNEDG